MKKSSFTLVEEDIDAYITMLQSIGFDHIHSFLIFAAKEMEKE